MFPTRYFPDRYFAPRYWPKVGADPAPGGGVGGYMPLLGVGRIVLAILRFGGLS